MADDMLIGVGVKADFSSLKAESRSAAETLKTAKQNMAQALQEMGLAAEQGSAQAVAALKVYEAELAAAQAQADATVPAIAAAGNAAAHSVPQYAAASGALRTLEGNFSHNIRAAERFLTTSLGLGPALQMAFPVVGAIAFAGVLYEMGKGLVKFGTDAVELSRELGNGWLDAAIAEMDGFADEVKQADKEIESLARNVDHLKEKGRELDIEHIRSTQGPKAAYEAQIGDQEQKIKALKASLALNQQQQEQEAKAALPEVTYDPKSGVRSETMTEDSIRAQEHLKQLGEDAKETTLRIADGQKEIQHYNDEIANIKPPKEPKDNSGRDAAKEHGAEVMAMVKENADAQREAQRVTEEVQAFGIRGLKEEEEEKKRAAEHDKGVLEDEKKGYEEQLRIVQDIARARMADETAGVDEKMREVRTQGQEGVINPQREAAQLTALVGQKQQIEDGYYLQLESLYLKDSLNWQQIEDQKLSAQRKNAAELIKIKEDAARQELRIYGQLAQTMNRELVSSMNSILTGQTSIARGAEQMASHMLISFVDTMTEEVLQHALSKEIMLAHEAAHWIAVNVLHTTSKATQTATDATANATQLATAVAANIASAMSYAAVAGAAGLASTAAIPFVGPFMAPGVAAGLYAAGLGFAGMASAAGGWDQIPSDQIAQVHKNEMMMSAPLAGFIRNAFTETGGKSSSGSVTNHFGGNTFNGVADQKTFAAMLQKNNREVARSTQRALRNGHFARGN